MQIQAAVPAPNFLEHPQPDISKRRHYLAKYYRAALPAIFRPHKLELNKAFNSYASQFSLTQKGQERWFDLFEVSPELGRRIPFSYITTSASLSFMYLLADLGINFKYVRHIASHIEFEPRNLAVKTGHSYRYQMSLDDVFVVRGDRVVVEVIASIFDESGQLCAKHREWFIVTNLAKKQVLKLYSHPKFNKVAKANKVKSYKRCLKHADSVLFTIPPHMGVTYGRVSGDMNIVHTTPLTARLLGYPKPFIQGFCTVNMILKQLSVYRNLRPSRLVTTFVRPVFVDEQVMLYHDEARFELTDLKAKVLAHGSFEGKDSLS